jgi:hypothetical protein
VTREAVNCRFSYWRAPATCAQRPGFGSGDEHARLCQRASSAVAPLFEHIDRLPYVGLQQMLDEKNAWGQYSYDKACHLDELTDEAIAVIIEHVAGRPPR